MNIIVKIGKTIFNIIIKLISNEDTMKVNFTFSFFLIFNDNMTLSFFRKFKPIICE